MITKQQLLDKVATMRTAVYNACSSCNNTQHPQGAAQSRIAYNNSFDNLVNAINNYFTDTDGSIQQDMYDIIQFDFTREMIKDYEYNPPNFPYPTEDVPVGESDYWDLFGMDGVAEDIMGYSDTHYFTECIYGGTTASSIETDVTKINNAKNGNDRQLRKTFINWLKFYPMKNQLINITEKQVLTNPQVVANIQKNVIGTKIYITKGAKSIIDTFNLDIYIPTYIVNS